MASPDSPGRILRIEDADTAPRAERPSEVALQKPCVVPGCTGTMYFHKRLQVADAPHTLEWPWYASWRCTQDSAHFQLISDADDHQVGKKPQT